MKSLKCYIIDDERPARKGLKEYIDETSFLFYAGEADNPLKALPEIETLKPDILFLDISMPAMSGTEFLRQFRPSQHIVFTTAHQHFAIESYELDVSDYLLKPVSYNRFLKAVVKIQNRLSEPPSLKIAEQQFIFVRAAGRYRKIFLDDILFVQSLQNYVVIHLAEEKVVSHITLKAIGKELPQDWFIRIHKQNIVNMKKVTAIEGRELIIGDVTLLISRELKNEVHAKVFSDRLVQ